MITESERTDIDVSRGLLAWLASNPHPEGEVVVCCEACGTYGFDTEMGTSEVEGADRTYYCNPECRAEALESASNP